MNSKESYSAPVSSGPNRQMLRRALVLMALFGIAAFAVLLARLFRLQIVEHARLEALAMEQQLREAPTAAARGVIYDTHMQPLAVSASVDNVYLSPAACRSCWGWTTGSCWKIPGRPARGT